MIHMGNMLELDRGDQGRGRGVDYIPVTCNYRFFLDFQIHNGVRMLEKSTYPVLPMAHGLYCKRDQSGRHSLVPRSHSKRPGGGGGDTIAGNEYLLSQQYYLHIP